MACVGGGNGEKPSLFTVLVNSSLRFVCCKTWAGAAGKGRCGTSDVAGHNKMQRNENSLEGLGGSLWPVQEQSNLVNMIKLIWVYFGK